MKTIFRTIIAALAAGMALVSCMEDNLIKPEDTVKKEDGARVIAISFNQTTKTTLDGFQPKFAEGDTIKISNGVNAPENRLVKIDDHGNAYITTDLMGALKAVYPASAALVSGKSITGVKVPATQSGKFADANICMADIGDAVATATFENKVAILRFYVDKSIGVKTIKVTSDSELASGSQKSIIVDPEGDKTIDEITDDPQKRVCYVAVLQGAKSNLKFSGITTTQGSEPVERTIESFTLAESVMYNAFIPYYIDLGKAGKWAYCNIGAFLPEEPGKYFAWGDTEGQTWNGSSWSSEFATIEGNPDTLKLENDAAHVIWDGSWRMPTKAQLDTLAASTKEWSTEAKGYKLYTSSADTSIFLPAAGNSEDMDKVGTSGEYWSSSLNTADEKTLAYKLGISDGSATTAALDRNIGATIRPFRHIPVESIELNKAIDTVKIGAGFEHTLTATISPANASDTLVTWTSGNTSVATIDYRGHITGVASGTAIITARITDLDGNEKSATCTVYVPAEVSSVTLDRAKIDTLLINSTKTLAVSKIDPSNTIIVDTTWTSDNTSIATVDEDGTVTGIAAGTAKITVKVKDVYNNEKTATCTVTVPAEVTAVTLNKSSIASLIVGKDTTLTISTIEPDNTIIKDTTWTSDNTSIATVDKGVVKGIAAGTTKITVTVKDVYEQTKTATCTVTVKPNLPAGALKGEFSVSATKKVHFSQGNLWADGDKALHFEANQYSSASSWNASHVSHFTWSSTVANAVGNSNSGDNLFCDESHKVSVDGGEAIYYALSKDEWEYLLNTRTVNGGTGEGKSCQRATINSDVNGGVYGVILYPDNYTETAKTSYTSNEWSSLEVAGCVFLPKAGYRDKDVCYNYDVTQTPYWSSTKYSKSYGHCMVFNSSISPTVGSQNYYYGHCVRLVTEVK